MRFKSILILPFFIPWKFNLFDFDGMIHFDLKWKDTPLSFLKKHLDWNFFVAYYSPLFFGWTDANERRKTSIQLFTTIQRHTSFHLCIVKRCEISNPIFPNIYFMNKNIFCLSKYHCECYCVSQNVTIEFDSLWLKNILLAENWSYLLRLNKCGDKSCRSK